MTYVYRKVLRLNVDCYLECSRKWQAKMSFRFWIRVLRFLFWHVSVHIRADQGGSPGSTDLMTCSLHVPSAEQRAFFSPTVCLCYWCDYYSDKPQCCSSPPVSSHVRWLLPCACVFIAPPPPSPHLKTHLTMGLLIGWQSLDYYV